MNKKKKSFVVLFTPINRLQKTMEYENKMNIIKNKTNNKYFLISDSFFYKKLSKKAREIYLDLAERRNFNTGKTIPRKTPGGRSAEYKAQSRALKALQLSNLIDQTNTILNDLNCEIWIGYNLEDIFMSYADKIQITRTQAEKMFHFRNGTLRGFFEKSAIKNASPNGCKSSPNGCKSSPNGCKSSPNGSNNSISNKYKEVIVYNTNKDHFEKKMTTTFLNIDESSVEFKKEIDLRLKGKKFKSPFYVEQVKKSIFSEGYIYLKSFEEKVKKTELEKKEIEKELKKATNSAETPRIAFKINPTTFEIEYL